MDALVDVLTNLAERGAVLLLTPKSGRDGHVQAERGRGGRADRRAARHDQRVAPAPDWIATRLVAPQGGRE